MRVIILSGLYPPHSRGGAETVALNLSKELMSLGHEVIVITTAKKSAITSQDKIKIYTLRPRNIFWYGDIGRWPFLPRIIWHALDIFNFWQSRAVKQILKKEKPDVVWSHNLKGLGFLIPRMLKKEKIKHMHTLHDIQLIKASGLSFKQKLSSTIYTQLTKKLFASPSVVTSPSSWLLAEHQKLGFFPNSHQVILPHVFAPSSAAPKEQAVSKFLFLGQLEATKGLPFLIETCREEKISLVVAGRGPLETYVQNSSVDYRGWLRPLELESLWNEISFTIVPSVILENSPTVILESFAHGVPVIAAMSGGIPELVQDGTNGFLFKMGDPASLREAVARAKKSNYVNLSTAALETHQDLWAKHEQALKEVLV